jgi:ribose transport system permease protein
MSSIGVGRRRQAEGGRRRPVSFQFARFSGLYLWAVMILIFALWIPDTFVTSATAQSIASDQAIVAVVALAVLVPLAGGQLDISVGQVLGASAIVAGSLMTDSGVSPALAIVITLCFGLGVGAVNGFLVAWVGVSSIIATLGTSSVLLAISGAISDYNFVGPLPSSFGSLVSGDIVGIPTITLYMAAIAIVVWYLLEHTSLGRRLYAIGASSDVARLVGVRTSRYVFASFLASGLLSSIAGMMFAAKIGQIAPSVGYEYLIPAFAACFLGMTQIKPGRANVFGTLLALFLLGTGVTGLQLVGGELWITELFNGIALILAVSAALLASRFRARRQWLAARR